MEEVVRADFTRGAYIQQQQQQCLPACCEAGQKQRTRHPLRSLSLSLSLSLSPPLPLCLISRLLLDPVHLRRIGLQQEEKTKLTYLDHFNLHFFCRLHVGTNALRWP